MYFNMSIDAGRTYVDSFLQKKLMEEIIQHFWHIDSVNEFSVFHGKLSLGK